MPVNVRLAGPSDEEPLYNLLMALAEDNNSFAYPLNEEMIREDVRLGTEHKGGIFGVVDGEPGELAGASCIVWARQRFTSRFHLEQIYFFVKPEYRKSHIADELMAWTQRLRLMIERDAGHPVHLINTFVSTKRLGAKAEWWRKHCGDPVGYIYVMR